MQKDDKYSSANVKSTYLPSLDGIRGIAIISVIFCHATVFGPGEVYREYEIFGSIFYAGWSGVDLFFVLSGFLITGILLDHRQSRYYFKSFYIRRILRIFPVYYFALIVIVITAFFFYSRIYNNPKSWIENFIDPVDGTGSRSAPDFLVLFTKLAFLFYRDGSRISFSLLVFSYRGAILYFLAVGDQKIKRQADYRDCLHYFGDFYTLKDIFIFLQRFFFRLFIYSDYLQIGRVHGRRPCCHII